MKKTRILKLLGLFCIILSFFTSVNAAIETDNFLIDETNVTNVTQNEGDVAIKVQASVDSDPRGNITFEATSTGVFNINVTGDVLGQSNRDLYFILTDSEGKEVRLASQYDSVNNEYITITDSSDASLTDVDVILQAGKTYTLKIDMASTGGCSYYSSTKPLVDNDNTTTDVPKETEYLIQITIDEAINSTKYYQSDISSKRVSSRKNTTSEDLEAENEEYKAQPITVTVNGVSKTSETKLRKTKSIDDAISFLTGLGDTVVNKYEETWSNILLAVGDSFISILNAIMGEEVTITSLVYNLFDPVNPNFFDKTVTWYGLTKNIKNVVSNWYNIFTAIAAAVYIMVLLAIGIHILLHSTGDGIAKAKDKLMEWVKGVAILAFMPYLIKYAFLINESIVDMLREVGSVKKYSIGSNFGSATEWSAEEIEYRSPEYVSKYTGSVVFGSDDATRAYLKKINIYENNLDLMRIMRGYAGATHRIIYVLIWYILIGQLLMFIVFYYKRYFMIAFLFAMFPLICIFNGISLAKGTKGKEVGNWLKEIMTNIFSQTVHAIIYTIITGVCISVVKENIRSSATLNWLLIILAINFMSEGEKLLRKIISALGNTASGTGATGQGMRNAFGKAKGTYDKMRGNGGE